MNFFFPNRTVEKSIAYTHWHHLYFGIAVKQLHHLKSIQNTLCRIIFHSSRFASVTSLLKDLHWLPVKSRIQFKIGLLTYNILATGLPTYLRAYINTYSSVRNTRASDPSNFVLDTPFYDRKTHKYFSFLESSFCYCAPRFWNSLPLSVGSASTSRSFKTRLKGYLFDSAFK